MILCAGCKSEFTEGIPFCPHCGAQAPAGTSGLESRDPLIGQVLARKFRVLSMLGEGGMGKVYKAEQVPLAVEVVVKTLHRHMAIEPEVVKRFFREAQSASRLRHPNCIQILDFGEWEGTVYIAMEFLAGRTLGALQQTAGKVEPARAVRILSQVLDVVEAAHRLHIVHRDLKPDNIMVEDLATQRDFVKVLDFGIAKIVDPAGGGARLTQTGMIIGTPAYMAPEQAMGADIDNRTDLYSIGIIAFEMLAGRLPFGATNQGEFIKAHMSERPPPLTSIEPSIPPGLSALIDRVLAKNPDQRPQTALEFKQALEASLTGGGAPARATGMGWGAGRTDGTMAIPSGNIPSPTPPAADGAAVAGTAHGVGVGHPPCPRCGAPCPVTAKFCPECGATTGKQTRSTSLGDKFADLRRFLPSGLVDELSQVQSRGPAEKRDIVALAVDVTGADYGSNTERAADALGRFYGGAADIALRHRGVLERRGGTSVIVFGLEVTFADDAERAVRAALDLKSHVAELNSQSNPQLGVSFAIHTGAAMIESSGTDYQPIGDTVELATRLAAASDPGRIIVSERIRQLVRSVVTLRRMAGVRLKGRSQPVSTHEVVGLASGGAEGGGQLATPSLVGRDAQLGSIAQLAQPGAAGHTVHVVGEPGSGKTRFLDELGERLARARRIVIKANADSTVGTGTVIGAIVGALGGSAAALRSLGLSSAEVRVLGEHMEGGERAAESLGEQAKRIATIAILRGAIAELATRVPVVLLLDDVHRADDATGDLIKRYATEPTPGVIVVVASRDGYPVPWQSEGQATSLLESRMSALPDDAIRALVSGALAPTPAPADLSDAVIARAGGSPLMALEVLRAMIDAGVLSSVGGRWAVTGSVADLAIPDGLRTLYAARIAALPDYARDVLACASVLGLECPLRVLDGIVGQAHGAPIDRELAMLMDRGILRESGPGRVAFVEPSAREVVYDRQPAEAKQRLHMAVATMLAGSSDAPAPEVIADHFAEGQARDKALQWYGRAVADARAAGELSRAAAVLGRSIDTANAGLGSADAAACNRRLAKDCWRLGEVLLDLGQLAEVGDVLTTGLVSARKDDDALLIARLTRTRGRARLARGKVDEAQRDLEQTLQAATGLRDNMLLADVSGDLGELFEKRGDNNTAARYLLRALELVQGGAGSEVRAAALRLLTALGRVALRGKSPDQAERFLQQALTLAEEIGDAAGAAKVLGNLAGVQHARGDYGTALKFTERALEMSRETGDQVAIARQLTNLGTLCTMMGDKDAAGRHFTAAYTTAQRAGWREGMATAAAGRDRVR